MCGYPTCLCAYWAVGRLPWQLQRSLSDAVMLLCCVRLRTAALAAGAAAACVKNEGVAAAREVNHADFGAAEQGTFRVCELPVAAWCGAAPAAFSPAVGAGSRVSEPAPKPWRRSHQSAERHSHPWSAIPAPCLSATPPFRCGFNALSAGGCSSVSASLHLTNLKERKHLSPYHVLVCAPAAPQHLWAWPNMAESANTCSIHLVSPSASVLLLRRTL